ncbi:GrpB family protein [Paenibacillus sp. RS8]|uniref:GrpB family protein n=1 Tax=Paenibacillus sp. RS8 TaxID=3242681 RepID=UPI0035C202C6
MSIAQKTKILEVVPYDPEWKVEFNQIRDQLLSYVGDLIITIEHVGSTSIEGLAAKPIIDLDLVMDSYEVFPQIIERLQLHGYEHQGNLGIEGREAFKRRQADEFMKYHLYVCPKNGKGYLEHIAFRDYLRSNVPARQAYAELKQRLAEQHRYDMDAYCEGKTAFVTSILSKAMK